MLPVHVKCHGCPAARWLPPAAQEDETESSNLCKLIIDMKPPFEMRVIASFEPFVPALVTKMAKLALACLVEYQQTRSWDACQKLKR